MSEDGLFPRIVSGIIITTGTFGFGLILSLVLALPAWISWNHVMPYLFGLKTISWSQAWALCWLGSAIFKSSLTQKVK